jgi:7,8-didemethyl-8-hydroxy-5-deazariboflavin synthase CofG subunit
MRTLTGESSALPTLGNLRPAVASALESALSGAALTVDEATILLEAPDGEETAAILAVAGHLRDHLKGRETTYSPKVFLPVTNLCRDYCSYCTFRKDPNDPGAWTMLPEEIRSWSERGHSQGCIEALMCLGDKPELVFKRYRETLRVLGHRTTIDYVAQACEIALDAGLLPHTNAGLMSTEEMRRLKPLNASMGLMLETTSERLRQRGGAHHNAPDKDPELRLRMTREAGELQIPFTSGILIGIGETLRERAESLEAIRLLHEEHGHIQEVIVQNFRAKPSTRMAAEDEPESLDMARTVAVARLILRAMNLQAPPNLSPYDHRLLLAAGINDWGGISPVTSDYVNPEARWPLVDVLAQTCRAAGYELRPRLPIYAEYLSRPGFLDSTLQTRVEALAAERGISS